MALIPATVKVEERKIENQGIRRIQWSNIQAGDTCEPANLARYADRSAQISGTFGGATVAFHGSLDDVFAVLTDQSGLDLTNLSSAKIKYIAEPTHSFKPVITGGDGTTDLTVTLLVRGEL